MCNRCFVDCKHSQMVVLKSSSMIFIKGYKSLEQAHGNVAFAIIVLC